MRDLDAHRLRLRPHRLQRLLRLGGVAIDAGELVVERLQDVAGAALFVQHQVQLGFGRGELGVSRLDEAQARMEHLFHHLAHRLGGDDTGAEHADDGEDLHPDRALGAEGLSQRHSGELGHAHGECGDDRHPPGLVRDRLHERAERVPVERRHLDRLVAGITVGELVAGEGAGG